MIDSVVEHPSRLAPELAPRRAQVSRIGPHRPAVGGERRLVAVSNRVGPIEAGKASQGGLAVAIRAALEETGGLWFGFSGNVTERPSGEPKLAGSGGVTAATLDLTRRDYEEYYIGYAQDEWRIRPGFTLSYGLRYEYYAPLRERNNGQVLFDIATVLLHCANIPPPLP